MAGLGKFLELHPSSDIYMSAGC